MLFNEGVNAKNVFKLKKFPGVVFDTILDMKNSWHLILKTQYLITVNELVM